MVLVEPPVFLVPMVLEVLPAHLVVLARKETAVLLVPRVCLVQLALLVEVVLRDKMVSF